MGVFSQQVIYHYHALQAPILQAHQFDMDALIQSVGDVIHPNKYTDNSKYQRFDEVSHILDMSYYDTGKLLSGKMLDSALKAYVDAIEDPYTIYMDPQTQS
ncbi:MAG: hypothetical protein GXP45_01940 [bacterium]|nr:hypothetical protein [bacterium]